MQLRFPAKRVSFCVPGAGPLDVFFSHGYLFESWGRQELLECIEHMFESVVDTLTQIYGSAPTRNSSLSCFVSWLSSFVTKGTACFFSSLDHSILMPALSLRSASLPSKNQSSKRRVRLP